MLSNNGKVALLSAFPFLFFAAAYLSLACTGDGFNFSAPLAFFAGDASDVQRLVFSQIALPRLAAAVIAGAGLALAGGTTQSLFANPLADPSIIGVSAGAALGAVAALAAFPDIAPELGALCGGLAAAAAVYKLGETQAGTSAVSTLLAGIAVNAFCAAMVGFFLYAANDSGLRGYIFWSLGSLERGGWREIGAAAALSAPAWIAILLCAPSLNLISAGRERAFHSGANVGLVWFVAMAAAAVATAAAVALCGIIGFLGLIVPHIARAVFGADNRFVLPASAFLGAAVLTLADVCARAFSPADPIPVGIITALLGCPFFLAILRKNTGGWE